MIRDVDAWLGKTLFISIIIRICQLTGLTQLAFNQAGWLAAGLYALLFGQGLVNRYVLGPLCIVIMLWGSRRTVSPLPIWIALRILWWAVLVNDVLLWLGKGQDRLVPVDVFVLFAEYAMTITTIPPRTTSRRSPKAPAQS